MKQSSSSEGNNLSASQEIPAFYGIRSSILHSQASRQLSLLKARVQVCRILISSCNTIISFLVFFLIPWLLQHSLPQLRQLLYLRGNCSIPSLYQSVSSAFSHLVTSLSTWRPS